MLNNYGEYDVVEEKARMKALVETFKNNENDDENEEEKEVNDEET